MAIIKTYSITTDITGGVLDTTTLHNDLVLSGDITNFTGVGQNGDAFDIYGDSFISETNVDAIVSTHTPTITEQNSSIRVEWINADLSVSNSGTFNGLSCTTISKSILYDRWTFRPFTHSPPSTEGVCFFEFILKDDYIDGNGVTIETHWTTSVTTGNIYWHLGLVKPKTSGKFGGDSETTYTNKTTAAPATSDWEDLHVKHTFSGTNLKKGDTIGFVIIREPSHVNDDMSGSAYIRGIKIIY